MDSQLQGKERLRIKVAGVIQGVGFRPFIHRLAQELHLTGWVCNTVEGVVIEVEADTATLRSFLEKVHSEKPPHAHIQSLESTYLDPCGYSNFEIRESHEAGEKTAAILPDIATCPDCLAEISDPQNRRYRYPFTNCTYCGPRYTIMEVLPYDRSKTSMRHFQMCSDCQAEYENPEDRRFHAQPNACPQCGPRLEWWDTQGNASAVREEALQKACEALREGKIVAVKGLGGFHLMVDARNEESINRLRDRKGREEKPFAVMFPDSESVKNECQVSPEEEWILKSPEAPIVLLRKLGENSSLAPSIAPHNPYLGVLLPYTPLHHLIMKELGFPLIATSGNLSDETICIDEREAVERLAGITDGYLVHDRIIIRHVDDSIVRMMGGREMVLRRARGFAPMPVFLKKNGCSVLAVGAHLKNTVAICRAGQAIVSQHIGDLETTQSYDAFLNVVSSFKWLYGFSPEVVACDLHPDFLSSRFAKLSGFPVIPVQHHVAHVLSCMAENEIEGPVLGISWDGTGYGPDQTIWGGEFILVDGNSYRRVAHFRPFSLPGNEKGVKEPRRSALGLLYEIFGEQLFSKKGIIPLMTFSKRELKLIQDMLKKKLNSPQTTSAGRLFDAVASLLGLCHLNRYEGQAPMMLEFAAEAEKTEESYPCPVVGIPQGKAEKPKKRKKKKEDDFQEAEFLVDWEPMIWEIIKDVRSGLSHGIISAKFHHSLAEAIVTLAERVAREKVVLTGGCFQNRFLTERVIERLRNKGFRPYWHQRIPPNDGGIALGQLVAVLGKGGRV
ncbi:MAG: carbamoyltransferase HypF [Candidatus Omnitrophica bacterium]|nr:carbamoyltransferase HypF [Candidatus Omnitrophota bacterium]